MRSNPLARRRDGGWLYGGQAASAALRGSVDTLDAGLPFFNVTQVTFLALNPPYPSTIKRYADVFAGVNPRGYDNDQLSEVVWQGDYH
jgi:hypothetical protein